MRVLSTTIYAVLCFTIATAIHLGPLNSKVTIGHIVEKRVEPHTDVEIRAANNVIGLLEYVRRLMPVGINKFLSVMEPYTKDVLAPLMLQTENGLLKGQVDLTNLVVCGAQRFTVHDIGVAVDAKLLEFNISVPEVVVDVDYEGINLRLGDILIFNTSGSSHVVLTNLNLEGMYRVDLDQNEPEHYTVTDIEVTHSVDDVEVNVPGQVPGDIVKEVKSGLMIAVVKTAVDELRQILGHFSVEQVKKFLEV